MTPEQIEIARKSLEEVFGDTAKVMSAEAVEILAANYCVTYQDFVDIKLKTLEESPNPVPDALLQRIAGFKDERAKKRKVDADMSASILRKLVVEVPSSLPPIDQLKGFLSDVNQRIPVTQRVYQKLSLVQNANSVVRICSEQEDADIVATFVSRIIESIHTTGAEELTAYAVTKMLFDLLAQITEKIEAPLKLGLEALEDLKAKFNEPFSRVHYGVLPYIIAYAAAGKMVQFYARRTQTVQLDPISDVIHYDTLEGRAMLVHLVANLYRLLLKMKQTLPDGSGPLRMFQKVDRGNGTFVEAGTSSGTKTICDASSFFKKAGTTLQHVKAAYKAAKATRHLVQAAEGPEMSKDVYRVVVTPLGSEVDVRDEEGIQRLVHHLLHGLEKLHSASLCHRDVRKPNAVEYLGSTGSSTRYMLIDLESAAPSGASLPPVEYEGWQDETLVDGKYVPESDLFQLAKMVQDVARTAKERPVNLSEEARAFLMELSGKKRSASSLLQEEWVGCKCGQGLSVE
ncbi:hypothetical protein KFL_000740180 [Klebsormidium nitens]|uniref:Protein kinase domain-containing protein n=1 Tax=Klebsormidium nitens TaxID=105231 RepID=A0A1Y1HZD4_KLENI|nr:hypothetical protein KFL_000740180 [Klebsormidium nitens]|eukprot:GAQ81218.1 hypothetical protein KFL_000740180 [Klebsormidium nitens]